MRNAFKLVIAVLASLLLTGTLVSVTAGPAAAAEPQIKVVDANLDASTVAEATNRAQLVGANIITLQEVCRTQLNSVTTDAGGQWKSEGSFVVTRPQACADNSDKGEVILLKKGSGLTGSNITHKRLYEPAETYRPFYLTCMQVTGAISGSKTFFVCTTHLFTNGEQLGVDGGDVRTKQMNDIEAKILPWAGPNFPNRKVIFTGDLNMGETASALNDIQGAYTDVCAGMSTTDNGSKLDYIFADKSPGLVAQNCDKVDHPVAGHEIMNGNVTFPS